MLVRGGGWVGKEVGVCWVGERVAVHVCWGEEVFCGCCTHVSGCLLTPTEVTEHLDISAFLPSTQPSSFSTQPFSLSAQAQHFFLPTSPEGVPERGVDGRKREGLRTFRHLSPTFLPTVNKDVSFKTTASQKCSVLHVVDKIK